MGYCRIDAFFAMLRDRNISIAEDREHIKFLLNRIKRGDQHRIRAWNFTLLHPACIDTHKQDINGLGAFPFRRLDDIG
ncbi:hypothetical protein D3C81_1552010 [compost metagenome]